MEYPKSSYITTETYYQGNLISSDYFKNNPNLFKDYPSQKEVNDKLSNIRNNQKEGVNYLVKISENGIEIIES
jgi:hypothetical protein